MASTVVAIIIHNRYANLQRWLKCWAVCDQTDAELVVIHNYTDLEESAKFKQLCDEYSIRYVQRENIGFDIGAMRDVFKEKLEGFPNNWDNLLWCTDDCIPMRKDFIKPYIDALQQPRVMVACTEISRQVALHIRTTGFCIKKEMANQIFFPENILTKMDCYTFEHRGRNRSFLGQMLRARHRAVSVTKEPNDAPLWDIESRKSFARWMEHNNVFMNEDRVTIICPIFNTFPEIISSMICQTHQNWELLLIHDGDNVTGLEDYVKFINDPRIKYLQVSHQGVWGHPIRRWALEKVKEGIFAAKSDYIVITNPDNYGAPPYLEYLIDGFHQNENAVATYTDSFVHGYLSQQKQDNGSHITHRWGVLKTRLELGWIDCGGVMIRKDIAAESGWSDQSHSSDWTYFKRIIDKYGADRWQKTFGCTFMHN